MPTVRRGSAAGAQPAPAGLLDAAPDATVVVNEAGQIVLVNQRALRMFGYTRGELVGGPVDLIIHADLHAIHRQHWAGHLEQPWVSTMASGLDLLARDKRGTEFPVELSLLPVESLEGLMISAAVRDLTDRKRTDQLFRAMVEASTEAIIIVDESGEIVMANGIALRLFGYDDGELVGQSLEILLPTELHGVHKQHRIEFFEQPRVRAMGAGLDLVARHKDGSEFSVDISLSPLRSDDRLLASATVRLAPSKRQEERLFRGLLEAAPDAMVIVDEAARIVLVNAQVEKLFGYDRTELIGTSVETLVPHRFAGMHHRYRDGYLAEPRTRPMGLAGDLFGRRKDGSEFPVEISLAPLETDEGLLVSAAVRDISERRRMQEETNRVKDEFFATVSHELRTPLTSMIGYGELMSDLEPLTDQGQRFLSVMMRSAERELRLVDDLLTLVQIDESGLSVRRQSINLSAVVLNALDGARPRAEETGLSLFVQVPDEELRLHGDPDRLGQALDNLLSNAIKFTPPHGQIRVELRADVHGYNIDVSDTGAGIGDVDPNRLFERLYRASTAVERQVPGAGLGLTIALAIVKAHGGTITVPHSGPTGTTFRITLPR